ncbi:MULTISPECIES: ABC transporter permease [Halanaerobium]|uniref:Monosaccharide ABC transporter membrane protein, CUT2 family n=1 Tax=Halanaerobium kushneri TaxID=56779 RepID=A0A1N6ZJ89_9FIRM|nr:MULTISPECIES: ABC transporter permease [Halanaerobium]RCW60350.1 monosaccharide ABC transporter membrane protein (CUT2 family) [Halanaerobium sp. ST460_2HS_T2]SIR26913.1 monosaccharide ABC transporter membrane protein, CUT2 family [Halanaerobium kushneri]
MEEKTVQDNKLLNYFKNNLSKATLFLVLFVMWGILSILSPYFFTYNNIFNLVRQTSVIAVVATGMTFVIISGGIDLSVGSIVGASGIIVSMLLINGTPILLAVLITLLICLGLGAVSGMFIYEGNVPPFIATLGMMSMARGLALLLSGGQILTGLPRSFINFAQVTFLGIPMLTIVLIVVVAAAFFVLTRTRFGRNVYTIGSSDEVARLSGINMRVNYYAIYMLNAFLSGVAGIMLTSRLSSGIPTSGNMYELDAIASVVIGGASLSGAEGSVLGTIIGALIMSTLRNGGNLLGVDPFWLRMATGLLIVLAVLFDQVRKKQ